MPNKKVTIYAVSSGSYSDYRINALFSTKAKAQAYIDDATNADDINNNVIEFELDPLPPYFENYLSVEMKKDGTVVEVEDEGRHQVGNYCRGGVLYAENGVGTYLRYYVAATDRERAIKVTNEVRTQLIALNLWDDQQKAYRYLNPETK